MIKKVVLWFAKSKENNILYTTRNEKENKDVYMVALRDEDGTLIGYYEKHEYRNVETAVPYDFHIEKDARGACEKQTPYFCALLFFVFLQFGLKHGDCGAHFANGRILFCNSGAHFADSRIHFADSRIFFRNFLLILLIQTFISSYNSLSFLACFAQPAHGIVLVQLIHCFACLL